MGNVGKGGKSGKRATDEYRATQYLTVSVRTGTTFAFVEKTTAVAGVAAKPGEKTVDRAGGRPHSHQMSPLPFLLSTFIIFCQHNRNNINADRCASVNKVAQHKAANAAEAEGVSKC